MIEVDLLKSGRKTRAKASGWAPAARLNTAKGWWSPRRGSLWTDRWVLASAGVILACASSAVYMVASAQGMESKVATVLEMALEDSVRRAAARERTRALEERRDAIAGRAAVIEELDAQRYTWPRIMSEVARALPTEAWLVHMGQTASDGALGVRLEGMATDNLAVARLWNDLEASPEIGTVQLVSLEHATEEGPGGIADVYYFVLEATRGEPL